MKRIFLILIFIASFTSPLYCQTTAKEKMEDALGRGYKAATEKKVDEAKEWFRKGMRYAKEANSWQGLLDSGYGLSTLGLPEEAKPAFDNASQIVQNERDWHGAVALGYAYASLPKQTGTTESAVNMWTRAKEWANENSDWCGLIEAGRGLMSISKNTEAEECFDIAKKIVKEAPTDNAIKALVQAYRKLGKEDKALECTAFQSQIRAESTIPTGWTPQAGETIRTPKTVSPEVQMAQRESADKDIERKQQWESEDAQRRYEEKLQKQEQAYSAYRDYLMYYSYPYYGSYSGVIGNYDDYYMYAWTQQPIWAPRTYDEIYNWASWNLGLYTCVDGVYISVGFD